MLGQYDVQLRDYFLVNSELRKHFDSADYNHRTAVGWWCLGYPDRAADVRHDQAALLDEQALRTLLYSGSEIVFGTNPQPWGSVLQSVEQGIRAASSNSAVAEQAVAEGFLRLEAGQPAAAAEVFHKVVHAIDPTTPWRTLLTRYYLQITGKWIDEPRK